MAKYYLSPGDIVQIQYDNNDSWVGFHTMIVTSEDSTDLYMTYHSNADGLDEVDKPLSSITMQANWRFVLVEIRYPWLMYLPTIFSIGVQPEAIQQSNPYPAPEDYYQPPYLSSRPYPEP